MRETTKQINRATDDPRMKATLEKTWLLQDRLFVPDQVCSSFQWMIPALTPSCRLIHGQSPLSELSDTIISVECCMLLGVLVTVSRENIWWLCSIETVLCSQVWLDLTLCTMSEL